MNVLSPLDVRRMFAAVPMPWVVAEFVYRCDCGGCRGRVVCGGWLVTCDGRRHFFNLTSSRPEYALLAGVTDADYDPPRSPPSR